MADSVHTINLSRRHLIGVAPSLAVGAGVLLAAPAPSLAVSAQTPEARINAAMQVVEEALAELYPNSRGLEYAIAFSADMHFVATCFAKRMAQ